MYRQNVEADAPDAMRGMRLHGFGLGDVMGAWGTRDNEKIARQRNACRSQGGNGETAHGQVRKNGGTESRDHVEVTVAADPINVDRYPITAT